MNVNHFERVSTKDIERTKVSKIRVKLNENTKRLQNTDQIKTLKKNSKTEI